MITINMELPEVSSCRERRCAYNVDQSCHARAITIGDGINPMCDTYFSSRVHSSSVENLAGVGACKVSACKYNDDFECQADHIQIASPSGGARCMTYST